MLRLSILAVLLALSAAASAEDFDYSFLTLGYASVDFDDAGVDGDGFGIGGSYAINPQYHVFAAYTASDLDFNIDASSWNAGFGYHTGVSDTVDLVAGISYEYVELDPPGAGSFDDSGLGLGIGLRFAANEQFEVHAGINYVDLSDSGSDTGFELGGLYNFNGAFALGLSGDWSDDSSAYTLSGRFYFDK